MHYLFDYNWVMDGSNPNEKPGNAKIMRDIVDAMIANGDTISIASKGPVSRVKLAERGFQESEFKGIFEKCKKDKEFFDGIIDKYQTTAKEVCLIDDDEINVYLAVNKLSHVNGIVYRGAHQLQDELYEKKFLTRLDHTD